MLQDMVLADFLDSKLLAGTLGSGNNNLSEDEYAALNTMLMSSQSKRSLPPERHQSQSHPQTVGHGF